MRVSPEGAREEEEWVRWRKNLMQVNQIKHSISKRDSSLLRIDTLLYNQMRLLARQAGLPIKTIAEICINEELGLLNSKSFSDYFTKEVTNEK